MIEILRTLTRIWGNPRYSAPEEFIFEMAQNAAATTGAIFECGTGLTTAVLLECVDDPRRVFAVEDNLGWYEDFCRKSRLEQCLRPHVYHSRIVDYADYDWYVVPPAVPEISLLVVDGPRGDTRGGRYGAIPRLQPYLAPGCLVMLDDAHRDAELQAWERWREEFGLKTLEERGQDGRRFLIGELP